jgi:hypothetical protein
LFEKFLETNIATMTMIMIDSESPDFNFTIEYVQSIRLLGFVVGIRDYPRNTIRKQISERAGASAVRRIDCGSRLLGTNRLLSRIHSPARVRARYNGASRAGGNLLAAGGFV